MTSFVPAAFDDLKDLPPVAGSEKAGIFLSSVAERVGMGAWSAF
jgi:hypothetical protein